LQAFVEAHRVSTRASAETNSVDNLRSILDTSTQPTGTQPTAPQPTTNGAKVEAIVAQITTAVDANEPPPFQSFTPTKSLSNSLTVDGFTLTLDTNASTQFYGIELSGNGVEAFNKHFGPSAGAGGSTLPPGVESISIGTNSNNEALDAVTVTQNIAASSSASVSSSSAGSASTSSVSAQSSSVTFLVNYATGQISAQGSALSVSAQSTQVGAPGSTLSTLA
jgi:lipid-binding SYLF domain-containing protein